MTSMNAERDTLIVVPCYNESRRLDVPAVERFLSSRSRVRLLFIDDGSTDTTAAVLEGLSARHPEAVGWKSLPVNSGKAEAVRQGVLAGLAESPTFIGYWDADLATPLDAIDSFLAVLDCDPALLGVLGSRIRRLGAKVERKPIRHYAGRIFATVASMVLGIAVYDTQCGAKIFRATGEFAQGFDQPFHSRWVFDVEVLARLKRAVAPDHLAARLYELPLSEWRDIAGSKLTTATGTAAFLSLWHIFRTYR